MAATKAKLATIKVSHMGCDIKENWIDDTEWNVKLFIYEVI